MEKKRSLESNWRHKTIENLEKKDYGNPNEASTGMVKRCLELCRIPLDEFTIEDLRLMIGQAFSLKYLVPLAIEHLHINFFAEGNLYPGDLLANVIEINPKFWIENKTLWWEVDELIKDKRTELTIHRINTTIFDSVF